MTADTAFDFAGLVSDLVAIETENPPGNERPCAEYVAEWFGARGVDAELIAEPDPERPQVAVSVGSGDPAVVLNGHLDVVPAGDRDRWRHPPYAGVVDDGRVYGRGAADMKAGIAVGMTATAALAPELRSGDEGTLVFHGAMGEETAEPGTEALLDAGYGGDFGVNLEPTGLRTLTSAKGLAWYEFVVRGDPAHASRPDRGTNAVDAARPLLDALAAYDDRVREREDDLVGRAYATVTEFEAGTKENVVPEAATLTLDRRVLPGESIADVDGEIESLVADVTAATGADVSWERTRTYESAAIPHDSAFADVFRRHSARAAGVGTDPQGAVASTDVRTLVNHGGVEAIIWGPCEGREAHTYDESVAVADVRAGHEVLVAALRDVFESPPPRTR